MTTQNVLQDIDWRLEKGMKIKKARLCCLLDAYFTCDSCKVTVCGTCVGAHWQIHYARCPTTKRWIHSAPNASARLTFYEDQESEENARSEKLGTA